MQNKQITAVWVPERMDIKCSVVVDLDVRWWQILKFFLLNTLKD